MNPKSLLSICMTGDGCLRCVCCGERTFWGRHYEGRQDMVFNGIAKKWPATGSGWTCQECWDCPPDPTNSKDCPSLMAARMLEER